MNKAKPPTEAQVAAYLKQHPDFFHRHLSLLEELNIPHPSGAAVSLVSKQLEMFRSKHREQEEQLTALIDIARDNDISFEKMHKLTLALLESTTLAETVSRLEQVFTDYFFTDFVAIRIIGLQTNPELVHLYVEPDSEDLKPFLKELSSMQIKCGRPTLAQAKVLFGDQALEVKSCAIIPMENDGFKGILAIGSAEQDRFHYSMGTFFLTQMSEIICTRLRVLLQQT